MIYIHLCHRFENFEHFADEYLMSCSYACGQDTCEINEAVSFDLCYRS